ncbi:MAG: nitrilase-related carbon-nitrogen hydrolase [Candidatus Lernaella stagnicola]|nr:nitrilase-related carbon-nitrogen hydrolase [Candidatus Lernaella stagnicola]
MSQTAKIAGVQLAGTPDIERNIRRATEMIDLAARHGAKVVVLPELWAYPWFVDSVENAAKSMAEPLTGPLIGEMRKRAGETGVCLVVPFFESTDDDGPCYNSAAVIDTAGEVAGVYRKVHVPQVPGWEERHYFAPGDKSFPVFDSPIGKIGVQLGWDMLFPEGVRCLALAGAEVVVAPMAVSADNSDLWHHAVAAGAFLNGVWICRVGRVGSEQGIRFAGNSACALPTGDFLDEPASDIEGVTLWEYDPRLVPLVRRDWPLLRDRRPEMYGALTAAPPNDLAGAEGESSQ